MKTFYALIIMMIAVTLASKSQAIVGNTFTDERDGQVYKTILIGEQIWMAENLNIGTFVQSTGAGQEMKNDGIIEKYCFNNLLANCDGDEIKVKLGGLYEWTEAMNYKFNSNLAEGICPNGWRLPNNDDWTKLINGLGGTEAYKYLVEGGGSFFEAKMTGFRSPITGTFLPSRDSDDIRTYFWSSTQSNADSSYLIELGMFSIQAFAYPKAAGICVRCILDESAGVDDSNDNNSEIRVSPNPYSDGAIKLELSNFPGLNLRIEVSDLLGNILISESKVGSSEKNQVFYLNTSGLSTGYYIVTVISNKKTLSEKFIVLK